MRSRAQISVLVSALTIICCGWLTGCYLIFPFAVTAPEAVDAAAEVGPADGAPSEGAPADGSAEGAGGDGASDGPLVPRGWSILPFTGDSWGTAVPAMWSTTEIVYLVAGNKIRLCYSNALTFHCDTLYSAGAGVTLHGVGGYGNDVYAVGSPSVVLHRPAGSSNWTNIYGKDTGHSFFDISCSSANLCCIAGKRTGFGTVTCWNGISFKEVVQDPSTTAYNAVWLHKAIRVAVGNSCAIKQYTATKTSWIGKTTDQTSCTADLHGVFGFDASDVHIVGAGGLRLRWTSGPLYQQVGIGGPNLRAVWGNKPTNLLAVGDGGAVLRFHGVAWQAEPTTTSSDLSDVHMTYKGLAFVVGPGSPVLRYLP